MTKEEFQAEIAFPVGSENEVFKKLTVGTAYIAPIAKGKTEALHMTLEKRCDEWLFTHSKARTY